jgi:hypothetical protein
MAGDIDRVGLDAVIQGVNAYLANSQKLIASNQKLATSTKAAASETQRAAGHTDIFGKVAVSTRGRIWGLVSAVGGLALAAGGLFAGVTLIRGFISAADEAQRIQAQTNAVITSTAGVAGVSSRAVNDLADSLSRIIPVDDEVIQSGENMLLTFTRIHSEMFPRATKAVLDMATAFNQGAAPSMEQVQTTAIRVGKALQDPIKGATALRRVGVALTDQQQEQIKTMAEAGDIMGAQTVILKELETEFGQAGTAAGKTFGGQITILRTQLGNVQEFIGSQLLPKLTALTTWFTAHTPAIERFARQGIVFTTLVMRNLARTISILSPPLALLRINASLVGQVFKGVGAAILLITRLTADLSDVIAKNPPVLISLATVIAVLLLPTMTAWAVATVSQIALNAALFVSMLAANAPVIALALAIGALAGEITYLVQHGDQTKRTLAGIGRGFFDLAYAIDVGVIRAFAAIPQLMLKIGGDIIKGIMQGMAAASHGLFELVAAIRNGMIRLLDPFGWVFGSDIVDVYAKAGKEAGDALMRALISSFDAQIGAVVEAARGPLSKFRAIAQDLQQEMSRLAGLPTKESAFTDLIQATLELRKLDAGRAQATRPRAAFGSLPVDAETKAIDKQLTAIDKLNERRKLERDILIARGQLADKTLATDAQVAASMDKLVGNISLLTDAISQQAGDLQTVFIPSWGLAEDKVGAATAGIGDDVEGMTGDIDAMTDQIDLDMINMRAKTTREINEMIDDWKKSLGRGLEKLLAIMSLGLGPLIWTIATHMDDIKRLFRETWSNLVEGAKIFGGDLADAISSAFKSTWNAGAGAINSLLSKAHLPNIPTFGSTAVPYTPRLVPPPGGFVTPPGGSSINPEGYVLPPDFGSGGVVPGSLGKAISITAHGGEVVLNRRQLRSLEGVASLSAGMLAMLGMRRLGGGATDSRMVNYGHQTFTLPEDTNAPFVRAMMRGLA